MERVFGVDIRGDKGSKRELEEVIEIRDDGKDLVSVTEKIIDVCADFQILTDRKFLKGDNQSKSSQLLGSIKGKKVFLKIFTQNSNGSGNESMVEAAIYVGAISRLIPVSCPFFVQPLAYQECDGFLNRVIKKYFDPDDTDSKDLLKDIIDKFEGPKLNFVNLVQQKDYLLNVHSQYERSYVIINEQLQETDVTLAAWLSSPHSAQSYKAIFYEIFWTLLCMEKLGLRHNDLQLGNIFVRTLKEERVFPFIFRYNKKEYNVFLKTRYKVLIYDFDRSTIVGVTDNTFLQRLCDKGYGCQTENFGYDLVRIVCFSVQILYGLSQSASFRDIIAQNPSLEETYSGGISKTIAFLSQFFTIQGKDLSKVKFPFDQYGKFCVYPPKDVLLTVLKLQKFPASSLKELKFLKDELRFDFNYARVLATDPFFEEIRSVQPSTVANVPYDKKPSITYSVPSKKLIKEIHDFIRESFPQIVYRPPIRISVEDPFL